MNIKIGIAIDNSDTVDALQAALQQATDLEVSWVVGDGNSAVDRATSDPPDLILLDPVIPGINGVEVTRKIMKQAPCAILVVTAAAADNTSLVYEAMGWGALDAVAAPVRSDGGRLTGGEALLKKIATIRKLIALDRTAADGGRRHDAVAPPEHCPPLVAIGASTGGPRALGTVLGGLADSFDGAVVIVQHIDAGFAGGLARWLDEQTSFKVQVAREGDNLTPRVALLAQGPDHLVMRTDRSLGYHKAPVDFPYHPSVDVFFESLARHWTDPSVAVLLTGMGRDGAKGMLALREGGWHTIAQDRGSSAVFGMPKAAVANNAAVDVLPVEEIAPAIVRSLERLGATRSAQ